MGTAARGRLVAWLVLGLVAAAGAGPIPGRRTEVKAPPKGGSPAAPKKVAPAAEPARDLQGEQQRLQQTQKQLKEERERALQARRREGSVLAELEEISRRLGDKQREVVQLDTRIRVAQAEVTALHRDIARLEGRRAVQEALLARRLRAIYKVEAQGGTVPVLLSSEDPLARATAVRHLTSLAALDARLIQEYRETSGELEDRRGRSQVRERELVEVA